MASFVECGLKGRLKYVGVTGQKQDMEKQQFCVLEKSMPHQRSNLLICLLLCSTVTCADGRTSPLKACVVIVQETSEKRKVKDGTFSLWKVQQRTRTPLLLW